MTRWINSIAALAMLGTAASAPAGSITQVGTLFGGTDCGGQGGFGNCFATQAGTQQGAPTSAALLGAATLYKRNSSGNQPTGSEDFGVSISSGYGSRFSIAYNGQTNVLGFTYTPLAGDPLIHYFVIKQAGSYALFYSADPITNVTLSLTALFPKNPGWSHVSFFGGGSYTPDPSSGLVTPTGPVGPTINPSVTDVPEPASLALLGFGLLGLLGLRRRSVTA